jgi:acetyltransferase-like isoleucine patch superfamily enzyme
MNLRGVDIFNNAKFLLYFASFCARILPNFIKYFLWDLSSCFGGYLALSIRYVILKSSSQFIGDNVYIGPFVTIKNMQYLTIFDNVSIHAGSYIDAAGGISIGKNVSISNMVSIISFNHQSHIDSSPIKYNPCVYQSIAISDDVWIGSGARILAGCNLSSRTTVGAGSVVLSGNYPSGLLVGIPARIKISKSSN